jgi:hypothetical protein
MTEPTYPLSIARKIVSRELCAKEDHKIERHLAQNRGGQIVYDSYSCSRCDVTITLTYPPLDGAP